LLRYRLTLAGHQGRRQRRACGRPDRFREGGLWHHRRSGAGREHRAGSARQRVIDSGHGLESLRARRGWSTRPVGAAPGWRGGRGHARRRQSQGRRPAQAPQRRFRERLVSPFRLEMHLAGYTFYTLHGHSCRYVFVFLKTNLVYFYCCVNWRLMFWSENTRLNKNTNWD
jgi:hypothetical protein